MTVSRLISFIKIAALLAGLVCVRAFEVALFQDPLQSYFLGDFQKYAFPEVSIFKLIALTSFRFLINTVLSLWILWFLYKKKRFLNAALWVYLFAFVILMTLFVILFQTSGDLGKMAFFYTRRFLIHPVILFVLVAGFYFLKDKRRLSTD